jgi:hypothetical protein
MSGVRAQGTRPVADFKRAICDSDGIAREPARNFLLDAQQHFCSDEHETAVRAPPLKRRHAAACTDWTLRVEGREYRRRPLLGIISVHGRVERGINGRRDIGGAACPPIANAPSREPFTPRPLASCIFIPPASVSNNGSGILASKCVGMSVVVRWHYASASNPFDPIPPSKCTSGTCRR